MLGNGEENNNFKQVLFSNHHNHHLQGKKVITKDIPKGFLPIKVGQGEEQQKIVVPVMYLNHPLFSRLLKEAEEEYGFDQQGTIIIPCHVDEFRYVQGLIDRERHPQNHHNHNHHVRRCFKASSV